MEYYKLPEIHVMFNDIIYYNDGTIGTIKTMEIKKEPKRLQINDMTILKIYRPDLAFLYLENYHKYRCNSNETIIDDDSRIIRLSCNHIFNYDCIENWLKNYSNKCPVCRTEVSCGQPNI